MIAGRHDFNARSHCRGRLGNRSLSALAVIGILGVALMLYNETNETLLAAQIFVVLGSIMYDVSRKYEKQERQLLAAEFMNALFASALDGNCAFCLVVKPEGEIVYLNHGFQEVFPEFINQPTLTLDGFLTMYQAEPGDSQRILSAVRRNANELLTISITAKADQGVHPVQLTIEPISRPSGFIVLRGRAI